LETEIKIEVTDLAPIRARLTEIGATAVSTVDEDNLYFDREGDLRDRQESLRLRRDNRNRLTWKGPGTFKRGVLARPELEIEVSDFDDTVELLDRLGFAPVERLAKHRETWRLADVEVALDKLDFGSFVELEGPSEAARGVANKLGLDLSRSNGLSYRQIRRARDPQAT
jgi:adenylate cyclase, class 2